MDQEHWNILEEHVYQNYFILSDFYRIYNKELWTDNPRKHRSKSGTEGKFAKESEKATKAQMNMLKLQLDPHFMFNSLNTLVGLIDEDPQKAEDFTLELSRIYKYIVANLDRDTISLKAGMAFINNYCKLIEIRYPQEFLLEIEDGIVKTLKKRSFP